MRADVEQLIDWGFRHLVPITAGQKTPQGKRAQGWPGRTYTAADFKDDDNIGAKLGAFFGDTQLRLYDVDLELPEAIVAADLILPFTPAIFGRALKARSHRLFVSKDAITTEQFKDVDGTMIAELRGLKKDGSIGYQTRVPPSRAGADEVLTWEQPGAAPMELGGSDLRNDVHGVYLATLFARHWPAHGRHALRLALAGFLNRAKVLEPLAAAIIEAASKIGGSDGAGMAAARPAVRDTYSKLRSGEAEITGGREAARLFGEHGERIIDLAAKALGVPREDSINVQDTSHEMLDRAWEMLSKANTPPGLFLRGTELVILPTGPQTFLHRVYQKQIALRAESKYLKRVPGFRPINVDTFRDLVSRAARCTKRSREGHVITCALPADFANLMLASPFLPVPEVTGFSTVPFFAPDGRLITEPGLHHETGIFYCPDPKLALPPIPLAPTAADLALALTRIDDLVWQFPFAGRVFPFAERNPEEYRHTAAYAHALAFVLTVLTRGMMAEIVPVFLFDKPKARTGASLLVQCLSYLVLGDWPRESEWDASQAERRKFLTAILVTGTPIIFLDDIKDLISPDLNKVITGAGRMGRELGKTNILDSPNMSTFAATGNNVQYDNQMANRVCRSRLDANVPHPEDRGGFAMVPKEWLPAHRADVLWGFYVLIQHWIASRRPEWTTDKLAGFETWSRTIGGILHAAQISGFLGDRKDVRDDAIDDEGADVQLDDAFLVEWITRFGSGPVTISALTELEHAPTLNGVPWTAKQYGPYLREQRDQWRKLADGRLVSLRRTAGEKSLWFVRVKAA
jgi:hypothetical protein